MKNFFKGIITGMGGVSPGMSGSILLVMFGLYEKTIDAIANIFTNFKQNFLFLFPLLAGMSIGFIIFGTVVTFFLENFEVYTRFAFLGLVIGTIPLLYREVTKKDFKNRYYTLVVLSFIAGTLIFSSNRDFFPAIADPTFLQNIFVGLVIAGASIVPGIDGAVILSATRNICNVCILFIH